MLAGIHCIVFDFGGTLSSHPYFYALGPEFLRVVNTCIWGDGEAEWCDPWVRGEKTSGEIADYLAGLTALPATRILTALDDGCARLPLHPAIWRFAQAQRAQGRHTALVTLNMDVFTRVIAPSWGFDQVFDVVINSSDYRTGNKMQLWEMAFSRLDGCTFANSLLIDDKLKHVESFRAHGGLAYRYTTDEAFARWAQALERPIMSWSDANIQNVGDTMRETLEIRHSARAVIVNNAGHVLLCKYSFIHADGEKVFWVTPGGGLQEGESYEDALKRELHEETGLKLNNVGSWLWTREVLIHGQCATFVSNERLFLVQIDHVVVDLANLSSNERETLHEFRWWHTDDIQKSGEEFSPPAIGAIVHSINAGLIPVSPVTID
jgi:8-oxo-dGTP pyrophosphatase MutT (NUDIX family)/FMN phosphatase YigB (HAD superfamily)